MSLSFASWLRRFGLGSQSRAATKSPRRVAAGLRRRPLFDTLEDRCVPATLIVNSNLDTVAADARLTLREAIAIANVGNTFGRSAEEMAQITGSLSSNNTIKFDSSLSGQTIFLTGTRFNLTRSVNIFGLGADKLTLDGGRNGSAGRQIFFVDGRTNGSITVTLNDMQLTHGHANGVGGTTTGGVDNSSRGGAVFNDAGSLGIRNCLITLSSAALGAAVYNLDGTLIFENSKAQANSSTNSGSALVNVNGTAFLRQSEFTFNTSGVAAGAIMNSSTTGTGTMTITNCTITDNRIPNTGVTPHGAGVYTSLGNVTTMNNTIVALNYRETSGDPFNTPPSDIGKDANATFSGSNNYIGSSATAGGLTNGVNGNIIPAAVPDYTDLFREGDSRAGVPISFHIPSLNSPVLDKGNNSFLPTNFALSTLKDARGAPRVVDGPDGDTTATTDIGAVEGSYILGPYVVDTTVDEDDINYGPGDFSLREAIRLANETPGEDTITFATGITNIPLTIGQLQLTDPARTTISGKGVTVQRSTAGGTPNFRIFFLPAGAGATLDGLTIFNGNATGAGGGTGDGVGGGINSSGNLTLTNCWVCGNFASVDSGGIRQNGGGTMLVINSTISQNTAPFGAGVLNTGTFAAYNTTFSGNTAGGNGGAFYSGGGTFKLVQTTITNNTSSADGGGILVVNGVGRLTNSIVAGNVRTSNASANDIFASVALDLANSFNNVIGNPATAGGLSQGANGNIVGKDHDNNAGTARITWPIAEILNPTLANNGGPTLTHNLAAASPARNAGSLSATVSNIAPFGAASQSSTFGSIYGASKAIDGVTGNSSFTHTDVTDTNASWTVTFAADMTLGLITLNNRTDCCNSRLQDITVEILNAAGEVVNSSDLLNPANTLSGPATLTFDATNTIGRKVRVRRTPAATGSPDDANVLSLSEVTVLGRPATEQRGLPRVFGTAVDIGAIEPAVASIVGQIDNQIYMGKSTGSGFVTTLAATWPFRSEFTRDVLVGDYNGDGNSDLAARDASTGQWYVGLSNGNGTFTITNWGGTWSSAANWVDVKAGDLNGDGATDLIGRVNSNGEWYANISDGSGSFATPFRFDTWLATTNWADFNLGDIDGNGTMDLVGRAAINGQWWATLSLPTSRPKILLNTWVAAAGVTFVDVKMADMNGDGRADIVGRWREQGKWYVSPSIGTGVNTKLGKDILWATWTPNQSVTWVDVQIADLDGDGRSDILARWSQSGQWWATYSLAAVGGANLLFGTWNVVPWTNIQLADFDGDGRLDLAGRVNVVTQDLWVVSLISATGFTPATTTTWAQWGPFPWANIRSSRFGN